MSPQAGTTEAVEALVEAVRETYGLELVFDAKGRCVLEHEDEYETLLALRDESRALVLAMVVSRVMMSEPEGLFADLLRQNLTGSLTGPFYFALDTPGRRVLLTTRLPIESLTAGELMGTIGRMAEARRRLAVVVGVAQGEDRDLVDAGRATAQSRREASGEDPRPSPRQLA